MTKRDYTKKLIYELELRNRSARTITSYVDSIERLFDFYKNKNPEKIEIKDIKDYQHYLFTEKKYAANSVNKHLSGIRFFYIHVLNRH